MMPSLMSRITEVDSLLFTVFIGILVIVFSHILLKRFTTSLTRKFSCHGKHVLITGGSKGIGLSVAHSYLKQGAKVTILARNAEQLLLAKNHLIESTGRNASDVEYFSIDVSLNYDEVVKVVKLAEEKLGAIAILVNCAGTSIASSFEDLSINSFESMIRTNYLGSVFPTRAVISGMKSRREGRIVFLSSQVAQVAIYGYTAYAASKWALRGFAEALQMETKPFNIFVSVVYPPDTDTEGYREEMKTKPSITQLISSAGHIFSPEEVACKLVECVEAGKFGISIGLDGWLLKQLHPGMSPLNDFFEVLESVLFPCLARFISLFYLQGWDALVKEHCNKGEYKT